MCIRDRCSTVSAVSRTQAARARVDVPAANPSIGAVASEYWTHAARDVALSLGVTLDGLTSAEAARRLASFGSNEIRARPAASRLRVLWRQVRSPLVLLLVFAAIVSVASGEWVDASMVGAILAASIGIGYRREYRAETAIAALLERIQITTQVVRDGAQRAIPVRDVVPGDIIVLFAGSIIPADAVLVEATELHVDDAVLTGESFPVLKRLGTSPATASLRERSGCVQFGTCLLYTSDAADERSSV